MDGFKIPESYAEADINKARGTFKITDAVADQGPKGTRGGPGRGAEPQSVHWGCAVVQSCGGGAAQAPPAPVLKLLLLGLAPPFRRAARCVHHPPAQGARQQGGVRGTQCGVPAAVAAVGVVVQSLGTGDGRCRAAAQCSMRCLIPCLPAQVASAPVDYIYAIGEMMPGGKPAPGIGSHAGEAGRGAEVWQGLPPPSAPA